MFQKPPFMRSTYLGMTGEDPLSLPFYFYYLTTLSLV